MTRRPSARGIDRATSGAIDFDAALEACLDDPKRLLQAAGNRLRDITSPFSLLNCQA